MGKWATYQKRGGNSFYGAMATLRPAPVGWSAITGGAGAITVTRFDSLPAGATGNNYRTIDQVTQLAVLHGATVTGLVSGRIYKVQAAWFNGTVQVSDWSEPVLVAAG